MPKHILIVEDHELFRKNLRQWVEAHFPECIIHEASSGEEALEIVQHTPPHVILMDITLPKMNGITTMRKIKTLDPAPDVIILTIHQENYYRNDALEAGATAYITKPTIHTNLLPVLEPLIASAQPKR